MEKYKIYLSAIDPVDSKIDIELSYAITAESKEAAIAEAKNKFISIHPTVHLSKIWHSSEHGTAEE